MRSESFVEDEHAGSTRVGEPHDAGRVGSASRIAQHRTRQADRFRDGFARDRAAPRIADFIPILAALDGAQNLPDHDTRAVEYLLENTDGSLSPFRYYFAQREAVETVIWLHDVRRARVKFDLLRFDVSGAVSHGMFSEDWPRYVLKMATGAGKIKVLSLLIAWSFFHKLYEPGSELSRNFLVIAPNIIVLDRLRADFDGLRIFFNDPILPDRGHEGRNWRDDFQLTLHIQNDVGVVRDAGNLFLTNIHRVFLGDVPDPSLEDDDLRDYFLDPFGPKPSGKTTDSKTDLGEIVREVEELAVFNDEAHHIHNPRMAWFKSIQDIHHQMLQKDRRLTLQVDVTATPRHDNGSIFVQTVSDYPLVEAIHQNVVKHPVLPDAASRAKLREHKSSIFTEKYADYLALGVEECLDIPLPKLSRRFQREFKDLAALDPAALGNKRLPVKPFTPEETREIVFKTMLDAEIHHTIQLDGSGPADYRSVVAFFARQLLKDLRLVGGYELLYPKVRDFLRDHLFESSPVDLEDAVILRNLSEPEAGKILYDAFKIAINALTISDTGTTRIEDRIRLCNTRPFRTENRPFLAAKKSIFTKTVGEAHSGGFELSFAAFREAAPDVAAFAKNYLAVGFKLDYVKADGDLSNYTPDFIVRDTGGVVWIIETKGREELDLPQKMARLRQWCDDATAAEDNGTRYRFVFVDQKGFETHAPKTFAALSASFLEYKA